MKYNRIAQIAKETGITTEQAREVALKCGVFVAPQSHENFHASLKTMNHEQKKQALISRFC